MSREQGREVAAERRPAFVRADDRVRMEDRRPLVGAVGEAGLDRGSRVQADRG